MLLEDRKFGAPAAEDPFEFRQDLCLRKLERIGSCPAFFAFLRLTVLIEHRLVTNRRTDRPCTELIVLLIMAVYIFSDDGVTSASRSMRVLAGGATGHS